MPGIEVVLRDGKSLKINASVGVSMMEAIRDNGVDELLAVCGGCCSCATCHVFIDPTFTDVLPAITEDESDLLDSSDFRSCQSRLSCLIIVTNQMDGMTVVLAPEN